MRHLLTLLSIVLSPLAVSAEMYFNDGMTWNVAYTSTASPDGDYYPATVSLNGTETINGFEALKMYEAHDGETAELIAYIRVDGERVYFTKDGYESNEWYLLYDFSLKVGEGCNVSYLYSDDYPPESTYIRCIDICKDDSFNGFEQMIVEEFKDSSLSVNYGKGVWLKGLSSEKGVTWNNRLNADGGGCILLSASNGDEIIYQKESANANKLIFEGLMVNTIGSNIYISNTDENTAVSIYSVAGSCIYSTVASTSAQATLPNKGIYILKVGDVTQKLILK